MPLVEILDELADLSTQHSFQGNDLLPYDCDFQSSIAQGRSHFETDETSANHDAALCSLRISNDSVAVG
jgi:hypothetical protein